MKREHFQLTAEGFKKLYEHKVKKTKTYKQAYEEAETEHYRKFGTNRYSDHDTFKKIYNKRE